MWSYTYTYYMHSLAKEQLCLANFGPLHYETYFFKFGTTIMLKLKYNYNFLLEFDKT